MQDLIIKNGKKKYICLNKDLSAVIRTQYLGERNVIVKNISECGVYLEISFLNIDSPNISFLCLRNEKIHLNVSLNSSNIEAIGVAKWGEEIYSSNNNFSKTYGLGIEFIEITSENKNKISSFIKENTIIDTIAPENKDFGQDTPAISKDPFVEKRTHPRVNIIAPFNSEFKNSQTDSIEHYSGLIVNLSEGGACLALEDCLPLHAILYLLINLSPLPYQIKCSLQILWNKSNLNEKKVFHGGSFIELDEFNRLILRKVLYSQKYFAAQQTEPILSLIDTHIVSKMKNTVSNFFINEVTRHVESLIDLEIKLNAIKEEQKNIQNQLQNLSEGIAQKGNETENIINHMLINKEIKKRFRSLISNWAYQSPLIKRAFEKPRGYAGDYKMLEFIYDNKPASDHNNIGYYYDNWFLSNVYALAVRNRKDFMKKYLGDLIKQTESSQYKVLNLACGSCREIRELLSEENIPSDKKIKFTCVDIDEESLQLSKEALKSLPENIEITFLKENILNMLNKPDRFLEQFGKYDLIYSIGLADYFPDRLLKQLIKFCFNLITPKGKFMLAHKDIDKYTPIPHDWFCDWTFYPRNEEKLLHLVNESQIENYSVRIEREVSGIIFFIILTTKP